jgi:hypothetical protein
LAALCSPLQDFLQRAKCSGASVVLESGTMLWKPFQFLIMSAVVMSNAIWHWTPNGLVAGVLGMGLAFVLTLLKGWCFVDGVAGS